MTTQLRWIGLSLTCILRLSLAACGMLTRAQSEATQGPFSEYYLSLADTEYPDLYQRALTLMRVGRYPEAEELYLQLAELEPQNANASIGLGASLLLQDRLEEAGKAYQRAAALSPESVQAHIGMGSTSYRLGQFEVASQQYRLALDQDGGNIEALWGLALALEASGQLEQAEDILQQIINTSPQSSLGQAAAEKLQSLPGGSDIQ